MANCAAALLRIDLPALVENYRLMASQVAPANVAAVVKANAYGLGAQQISLALSKAGCTRFFVANLQEANALRPRLLDHADIFILNGLLPDTERQCWQISAIPVLNSLSQVRRWANLARAVGRPLRAALQMDSGMSRLGLSPAEVQQLSRDDNELRNVEIVLTLTHLACADDAHSAFNDLQLARFEEFASKFPGVPKSLANSGGSFLNHPHFDVVRAGIALYGGTPQIGPNPMRPVVSLEVPIIQIREISACTGVGYGLTHKASQSSRIATISVGYADGWPRHLSNRGSAFIAGVRVPIVGQVSMDSITLDVSDVPAEHLYAGNMVELLGPHQSLDDVAADAGTISYEILTQLGHRYHREYAPANPFRSEQRAAS